MLDHLRNEEADIVWFHRDILLHGKRRPEMQGVQKVTPSISPLTSTQQIPPFIWIQKCPPGNF
jgi:hypothetical protein